MHIVTLVHGGNTFYLRNTIWSMSRDRATEYPTKEAQARRNPPMSGCRHCGYRHPPDGMCVGDEDLQPVTPRPPSTRRGSS